jgi:hypothetical protein
MYRLTVGREYSLPHCFGHGRVKTALGVARGDGLAVVLERVTPTLTSRSLSLACASVRPTEAI